MSYDWRVAVFNEMHRALKDSANNLGIIERNALQLSRKITPELWRSLTGIYGKSDMAFVRKWIIKLGFMEVLP